MKRLVTLGLAIALLIPAVTGIAPRSANVQAQGAGLVSSILNRIEQNQRSLRSLRAGISMEKFNAQLGENDKRQGLVRYVPAKGRSANVRVDWQRPDETLAVLNGQYTLYIPRKNMAYVGNARSNKNKVGGIFELMNLSGAEIRSRYQYEYLGGETLWGGVRTDHFKFTPKGAANYKYAEAWADASGMIVQTKVIERNDDTTTVRLTNIEKNARVSSDDFRLNLPGDVKKVKG
ncbi:MAG: outer membrane lipoprotein carrier protein LolA [Pyrinomonadaceae bacterium]